MESSDTTQRLSAPLRQSPLAAPLQTTASQPHACCLQVLRTYGLPLLIPSLTQLRVFESKILDADLHVLGCNISDSI